MRKATTAAKIEHKRTPCLRRCNSATFLSTVGSLKYGWMKELLPKFGLQLEKDLTCRLDRPARAIHRFKRGTIDASLLSSPANFLAQDAEFGRHPGIDPCDGRAPGATGKHDAPFHARNGQRKRQDEKSAFPLDWSLLPSREQSRPFANHVISASPRRDKPLALPDVAPPRRIQMPEHL